MKKFRFIFSEDELENIAQQFVKGINDHKHFALYGTMGAGKTTFITAVCKVLGTHDLVSSPTFAIVNEYATLEGSVIYHLDFYRINNAVELLDIGFYDYCDSNYYCFIEWPEKAPEVIPEDFISVNLQELESGLRELSFELPII